MFQMVTVKYNEVDARFCKLSRHVKYWVQMQGLYTQIAFTRYTCIFWSYFIFSFHFYLISYSYKVIKPGFDRNLNAPLSSQHHLM